MSWHAAHTSLNVRSPRDAWAGVKTPSSTEPADDCAAEASVGEGPPAPAMTNPAARARVKAPDAKPRREPPRPPRAFLPSVDGKTRPDAKPRRETPGAGRR